MVLNLILFVGVSLLVEVVVDSLVARTLLGNIHGSNPKGLGHELPRHITG